MLKVKNKPVSLEALAWTGEAKAVLEQIMPRLERTPTHVHLIGQPDLLGPKDARHCLRFAMVTAVTLFTQ